MGADGGATRFDGDLDGPERPRHDVLDGEAATGAEPSLDGAYQVSSDVEDRLGRKRLVEVGVRLGEATQQQHSPEVVTLDRRVPTGRSGSLHRRNHPVDDGHVDALPAGQQPVGEDAGRAHGRRG